MYNNAYSVLQASVLFLLSDTYTQRADGILAQFCSWSWRWHGFIKQATSFTPYGHSTNQKNRVIMANFSLECIHCNQNIHSINVKIYLWRFYQNITLTYFARQPWLSGRPKPVRKQQPSCWKLLSVFLPIRIWKLYISKLYGISTKFIQIYHR